MDPIDRDLAIRTVLSEAGNQGADGMAAVANVIRNRMAAGRYGGKSAAEVVTARNQFEPWNDVGAGKANDPLSYAPTSEKYQNAGRIVDAVFSGAMPDNTKGSTHFYAPTAQANLGRNAPSWARGQQGLKIGDHMFYAPDGSVSDLSQGLGNIGQDPDAPTPKLDPGAVAASTAKPPGALGATGAAAPSAGGTPSSADLLRMFMGAMGKQTPAQPTHGALNQLLFGPQGWQALLGKSMPNGLLGGMFGGGPSPAPSLSPGPALGAPMQLGPSGGAPTPTPPPPAPASMTALGAPVPSAPEGPPLLTGLGGGGMPGGNMSPGGGNPLSMLASIFGLGGA